MFLMCDYWFQRFESSRGVGTRRSFVLSVGPNRVGRREERVAIFSGASIYFWRRHGQADHVKKQITN
jgi:hypothetical protein